MPGGSGSPVPEAEGRVWPPSLLLAAGSLAGLAKAAVSLLLLLPLLLLRAAVRSGVGGPAVQWWEAI